MKIHTVGADLFHVDGQTDRRIDGQTDRQTDITNLIVAFLNFMKAPTN